MWLRVSTKADRLNLVSGDYRICSAQETYERVSPHLTRLGITRVGRQTNLDKIGIPVWCAYSPNSKAIVIAQGKGLSDEIARTSAVMEAVERSVATQPTCTLQIKRLETLRADGHTVSTLNCLLSSKAKPITPDELITWAQSVDLASGETVWIPFEAVHLDRTTPSPRYWQSSDGVASGNTRDEAILHALLERVERDAITLWQVTSFKDRYNSRVSTHEIVDAGLQGAVSRIAKAGLDVALFDITTDLGLPCFAALIGPDRRGRRFSLRHVDITLGAGASLFPEAAASRAITEAVQSRMTFIAGARDDLLPSTFTQAIDPETLVAFDAEPSRHMAEVKFSPASSAKDALAIVIGQLQKGGISEILVVDLAPDWLPAAVVKVFVPQLENPDGDRRKRFGSRALSKVLP